MAPQEAPAIAGAGYRLLLMFVIVGINAFFSAAETALVSVRPSRLKSMAAEGAHGAHAALSLLANPERLLSVVQVGVTLTSLALGWVGEDTLYALFSFWIAPEWVPLVQTICRAAAFILAFVLMTYVHVVAGEVVPKNFALGKADRFAVVVAPVLLIFYRITEPFVFLIERGAAFLSRLLGSQGEMHSGSHSPEELRHIAAASQAAGQLEPFESAAIGNVLNLRETLVREVMTPRNAMVMVPVTATIDKVLEVMSESRYSRLPVHDGTGEKVLGIVHVKDILDQWAQRRLSNQRRVGTAKFDLRSILRKAPVVPETKPCGELLDDLREEHAHIAVVVDEFGTIAGLVSMEDVMEQIFGEIEDEFDPQAKELQRQVQAAEIEVEGTVSLVDLDAQYGIELPADPGYETLAGFLLFRLGRIPAVGETVEENGRLYKVTAMQQNRIAGVTIRKP